MFTGKCSTSPTEGQLEKVLPGLRLWAQSGSFFLLLIAGLTCVLCGLCLLLCWPISLSD